MVFQYFSHNFWLFLFCWFFLCQLLPLPVSLCKVECNITGICFQITLATSLYIWTCHLCGAITKWFKRRLTNVSSITMSHQQIVIGEPYFGIQSHPSTTEAEVKINRPLNTSFPKIVACYYTTVGQMSGHTDSYIKKSSRYKAKSLDREI